jgi:hypothetical protein
MSQDGVQVVVRGAAGSPEDWARVVRTEPSDLPRLSQDEKERISRFNWDQQDYARGKLLSELAEQKWRQKGNQLASRIQDVLKPVESDYRLETVLAEVPKSRWTARFSGRQGSVDIHFDDDFIGDLLNFNALEDAEKLRRKLLIGLGEERYLVSR